MCIALKYGVWNAAEPGMEAVNALVGGGYGPLAAMVLAARGMTSLQQADMYLDRCAPLPDPFLMTDMDKAAERVRYALEHGQKIAVYGDYDVDGITATCLLTDFLRRRGADCVPYIPGRLEEGYGLNPIAINALAAQGVRLIVTVDCGITAVDMAQLCAQLGIDLVITDHHECKQQLPEAVAVVDPHRPDGGYPHKNLSGVGVAFKLAAALCGDQEAVLQMYADMVCLGTVADVMPLLGENRVFVTRGLEAMRTAPRPGIAALGQLAGCDGESLNASNVGYLLAPRINAAGRMGSIDLAVELMLTDDPVRAMELAEALCDLNRRRQSVEAEIYAQAIEMLPDSGPMHAIVLADEQWHQGVVGIVASRIAEEYCCPTFLVCLDGEHGKASSRSYGGFNLFASLTQLSELLESYGGHELAAGFTIRRDCIDPFRRQITELARQHYASDSPRTVLTADCKVRPELLTVHNIDALRVLEPCGTGCPKPLLILEQLQIERISTVGGGKHMRLRLRSGHYGFNAIYFSATPESASVEQGDLVDVAFHPQVNEFRGERSVQLNVVDIRPSCKAECSWQTHGYSLLHTGTLSCECARQLLPDRATLATVWRYLECCGDRELRERPMCLLRKIVRRSGQPLSLGKLLVCLDIFTDVGLLCTRHTHNYIGIRPMLRQDKADLSQSRTMQRLLAAKENVTYGNL